ncbi:uncharacterized protein METZ01_LOCUS254950 [marine metagenome]|uniref:Uncharacterized protein n=1 Tax=marine metagenome TaxID=408172 RepID=A0A382IR58_9ZZZZ
MSQLVFKLVQDHRLPATPNKSN